MSDDAKPFDPRCPPIYSFHRGHPIPDLNRIPREHWVEVMRRAHPTSLLMIEAQLESEDRREEARAARFQAEWDGPIRETVSPDVLAYGESLPGSGLTSGQETKDRQMNFRLPPPVFAELEHAARIVRMRPTALARLLVTRGVTQILREATERA